MRLLADLDMEQVGVAEMSDRRSRLLETFRYWENEAVIVGQVNQAGIYQAYAWPKHPGCERPLRRSACMEMGDVRP
jgi:hypothetical protein